MDVSGFEAKWKMGTVTPTTISSLSRETLRVQVAATQDGKLVDPTTGDVEFAFVSSGNPDSWNTGEFCSDVDQEKFFAEIIVGQTEDPTPSGIDLAVGTHTVWVRVTLDSEVVVKNVGKLKVI